MYSTGRPRIEYATSEPGAKPGEPYIIVADRVLRRAATVSGLVVK